MTVQQAKQVLRDNGFAVENLWQIGDSKQHDPKGILSDDDHYDMVSSALENEWIVSTINETIQEWVEQAINEQKNQNQNQ